jgi:tetratricopeptide (TPR) repeat protein
VKKLLARRYYRLGLAAAKERRLSMALRYAQYASIMDRENDDAAYLAEICENELYSGAGETGEKQIPEQTAALISQKRWYAAARSLAKVPSQSVRCLAIQGCLWALAKRRSLSVDCFSKVLAKDRENNLALKAVFELIAKRNPFWRFF